MIDPFTLITGVAGLISLAIEVTKITNDFASSVKGASGQVQDLLNEIVPLKDVLQQFDNFLKTQDSLGPFAETCALISTEQYCTVKLKQLYEKLRHLTEGRTLRRGLHALAWPYKERETAEIILSLHRCAQTFQLALTVDQWYAIVRSPSLFPPLFTSHTLYLPLSDKQQSDVTDGGHGRKNITASDRESERNAKTYWCRRRGGCQQLGSPPRCCRATQSSQYRV